METLSPDEIFQKRKDAYYAAHNDVMGFLQNHFDTVTHRHFGFPLTLSTAVYMAHPAFSYSSGIAIDLMGDLTGKDVADVGCGSGVIALAAAFRNANRVVACDILPEAVHLTEYNAQINNVADKITALQSDVLETVVTALPEQRYDLVVGNLWFPARHEGYEESREFALNAYDRFFAQAGQVLKEDGTVYLTSSEFSDIEATHALFERHHITPHVTRCVAPLFGGRLDIEMHLYSFGKNGAGRPPLYFPAPAAPESP